MAGQGYSGKDGTVKIGSTDVAEIRNWKFNPKSNNPKYASNKTSGYKRTVAGVKEGSGSMSGAWDHAIDFLAVVDVGTSADLKLYTDTTHFFLVPSVIDDCSINVDVDNGEIVSWDSNFSTNGAWTNPASPFTAPEGFGMRRGADGRDAVQAEEKASPFTKDQLDVIAAAAAQAASMALAAMLGKTNPNAAQSSEPSEPAAPAPAPEFAEPGTASEPEGESKTVAVPVAEAREKRRLPKP